MNYVAVLKLQERLLELRSMYEDATQPASKAVLNKIDKELAKVVPSITRWLDYENERPDPTFPPRNWQYKNSNPKQVKYLIARVCSLSLADQRTIVAAIQESLDDAND